MEKPLPDIARKPLESVISSIATGGGFTSSEAVMQSLARIQALGTTGSIFHDVLYGINRATQGNNVPSNTDMQGLTFFTRPSLNLTYDNVAVVRELTPLLSREPKTYQSAIRNLLDPDNVDKTPLIDDNLPFMALLSNSIVSCSGWPDLRANAYMTNEGLAQESWMMNDKIISHNGRFDLTCNFQNMLGDPITLLFFTWLVYMGKVYTGIMTPYPQALINNEIDYMTRIYRFVLDYSGTYIQKWVATGIAMPTGIDIGNSFNFSRDTPYNEAHQQIQISFAALGAMYNDPIVLDEFNKTVQQQNPDMLNPSVKYHRITSAERQLFNFNGYPLIDLNTNELQWWVPEEQYKAYRQGNLDYAAPAPTPPAPGL
jgi:hypothetical protein